MVVKKRINNNVVYAQDGHQKMVVMGKGIGFQKYPGDEIKKELVEKVFLPTEEMALTQIALLTSNLSIDEVTLVEEVIALAEKEFGTKLGTQLLFPLVDHINYAIQRTKENIIIRSPIHFEVKKFYPNEVRVGKMAVELINNRMSLNLPDDEAVFIALHFVNALFDKESIKETVEYTEIMSSLTAIVRYHFNIDIDEESFIYNRFITHLRYYLMRRKNNETIEFSNDDIVDTILDKFTEEAVCADKIADYLFKRYGWETPDEEKVYLALHINCIKNRTEKNKK